MVRVSYACFEVVREALPELKKLIQAVSKIMAAVAG